MGGLSNAPITDRSLPLPQTGNRKVLLSNLSKSVGGRRKCRHIGWMSSDAISNRTVFAKARYE